MKSVASTETPFKMNLQLFADSGDPGVEETPTGNDVATEPDEAAKSDDTPGENRELQEDADDLNARLNELQTKLQREEKKRKEAEAACSQITRENSKLKRSQMTEAERLAEQQREADEKAKQYDRMMSSVEAEKIFVSGGLKEDDYKDFLELFVSEDKDKTVSIAQGFVDILGRHALAAAKTEREKVLKETPAPPMGKSEEKDSFVEGFQAG